MHTCRSIGMAHGLPMLHRERFNRPAGRTQIPTIWWELAVPLMEARSVIVNEGAQHLKRYLLADGSSQWG